MKISNNALLRKYFETVDYEDYSVAENEDFESYPNYTAQVCSLCSTAIEGERNDLVKHLHVEHKKEIKNL